jgi:hypothetical protein
LELQLQQASAPVSSTVPVKHHQLVTLVSFSSETLATQQDLTLQVVFFIMPFAISMLWSAPEINPYNKKATSIPVLNPINKYGRVFFFSYLGFFIAFWSW